MHYINHPTLKDEVLNYLCTYSKLNKYPYGTRFDN